MVILRGLKGNRVGWNSIEHTKSLATKRVYNITNGLGGFFVVVGQEVVNMNF